MTTDRYAWMCAAEHSGRWVLMNRQTGECWESDPATLMAIDWDDAGEPGARDFILERVSLAGLSNGRSVCDG